MEQLADDYTQTALKAEAAGARIIEFNLSCPNVCSSALLTPAIAHVDGVVAINTIPMCVVDEQNKQALPG